MRAWVLYLTKKAGPYFRVFREILQFLGFIGDRGLAFRTHRHSTRWPRRLCPKHQIFLHCHKFTGKIGRFRQKWETCIPLTPVFVCVESFCASRKRVRSCYSIWKKRLCEPESSRFVFSKKNIQNETTSFCKNALRAFATAHTEKTQFFSNSRYNQSTQQFRCPRELNSRFAC